MTSERCSKAYALGHWLCRPLARLLFGFEAPQVPDVQGPVLVISNHTFDMDFTHLMGSFRKPMHFVIGEALFRTGWLRSLLVWLHDPVILQKEGTDARAAIDILHRLRKGHSVCLFAEGNTTFDGVTGRIPTGTSVLARASGATLITYRLHGGYFSMPRWGRGIRKGRTWAEVAGVYPPEKLKAMTDQEMQALMVRDLRVDAAEDQGVNPIAYNGTDPAEGLENLLYLCPGCGQFGTLKGHKDQLSCRQCALRVRYTPFGTLEGDAYAQLKDWAARQHEALRRLAKDPSFALTDTQQSLYRIDEAHERVHVGEGTLSLGHDGLSVGDFHVPLADLTGVAVFRKNRLLFSVRDGTRYEVESPHVRSTYKYKQLYELLTGKE